MITSNVTAVKTFFFFLGCMHFGFICYKDYSSVTKFDSGILPTNMLTALKFVLFV